MDRLDIMLYVSTHIQFTKRFQNYRALTFGVIL